MLGNLIVGSIMNLSGIILSTLCINDSINKFWLLITIPLLLLGMVLIFTSLRPTIM